ncbi:SRPBCC family protein [Micromonospora sp. WMMD987]|uniref:SRPBCC family protein n=1 Tax=Micromonospora sp. WMMD987 TaxID=3016089 RepID=UPI00249AFC74|nr:SRPBCC family protein [Micromonospora sp. WMMD987]WFE97738.1 SRPBCC family protein [Micromonospora sp. WMMD987]
MIEIGTQIDLLHPADRVWRAVTDPGLLGRWFADAEALPGGPDRWRLRTAGLSGFDTDTDIEGVDRRVPELLVVRCREGARDSLLTCAVTPTEAGCRILVRETVEHGDWPAEQGTRREECYRQALAGRLPALLDWLAFREVDLRRDSAAPTAVLPVVLMADVSRPPYRRRRTTATVVGLGVVTLALGLAGWVLSRGEPPADRGAAPVNPVPGSTAPPGPARSTATVRPTPTPTPSGSARPSRTPSATPSRRTPSPTPTAPGTPDARYETVSTRLFGYTAEVVVANPDGTPTSDWTVRVTLPRGSSAAEVSGADWRQDGQTVTFTGPAVPAGGSQVIRFDVRTADPVTKAPAGCTVDERPCAGL